MTQPVECLNCKALPPEQRPKIARRIDKRSGPRSPRCYTHFELVQKARRQRASELRTERIYGMTPADYAELAALQGHRCPCGNRIRHRDHDHRLARQHDHPEDRACKLCMRGLLCAYCNSEILGRGYTAARLRALADYVDNPPAAQLWRDVA